MSVYIVPRLWFRVEVKPGDVYEFAHDVVTRGGHVHLKGARLTVDDFTTKTPHGELGPDLRNWVCTTVHGTSVWATLEQCIERSLLVKK